MKDEDIEKVVSILEKEVEKYDSPVVELEEIHNNNPFKILVSTILSARTRDETTKKAINKLFKKVNSPKDLRKLSKKEIEELIYPVGFYHNKAGFLKKLPEALEDFDNKFPQEMSELLKIPGVGRKTANIVLSTAFNKPAIAVDTHVHRIMNRLGYVSTDKPEETEKDLMKKLPKKYWNKINYLLVSHGQNVCTPISPYCSKCGIREYCEQKRVENTR